MAILRSRLLLLATLLAPCQATAQANDRGLAACALIQGDLLRLACFDSLAVARGATPSTSTTTDALAGQWRLSATTNPLDDSKTVTLILQSQNAKSRFGKPVALVLRCKSKNLEAYINWNDYLGTDDAQVTIRLGQGKPQTKGWSTSTDHVAAFYPGDVADLVTKLQQVDRLVAQVTPYSESPVTAIFEVGGLGSFAGQLMEGCPGRR